MNQGERNTSIETFHRHLDACAQCRLHPFDLCPEGLRLVKAFEPVSRSPFRERAPLSREEMHKVLASTRPLVKPPRS